MMNIGVINDLKSLAAELSNKLGSQNKYFTGVLAARLQKAAHDYPSDNTIRAMYSFLNRRASAPGGQLITRAELNDVYSKLYHSNTKCADFLEKELGKKAEVEAKPAKTFRDGDGQLDLGKYTDHKLASVLESALLKEDKPLISKQAADAAVKSTKYALPGQPLEVVAVAGDDDTIICRATYETPRGNSSVLVPVEFTNNKALIPSVFVSRTGFVTIAREAIKDHLLDVAGKQFKVDANKIFRLIKQAKGEATVDEVERILVLAKQRQTGLTPEHSILEQKVDEVTSDIKTTKLAEADNFASRLSTASGVAEFVHGQDNVKKAKNVVLGTLRKLGYNAAQVKVIDVNEREIVVGANVSGVGFKVIAKVNDGKLQYPSTIIANGGLERFDAEGIKNAARAGDRSLGAVVAGYNLDNPNKLVEAVEVACESGDMTVAAEALNALSATGDEKAFQYAFEVYSNYSLGNVKKVASAKPKIKTIKIGGNEVCATTGLPVDKVYVDEYGNIQAKHRSGMDKTASVASGGFMHSKILMGL